MKPFNLEEALQGNPVQLRNGCKAIVYYRVPDTFKYESGNNASFPLKGLTFDNKGNLDDSDYCWSDDGSYDFDGVCETDIVGMWEEPTPTVTVTLPKPFLPKKGEEYYFIRQNGFGSLYVDKKVRESVAFEYNAFKKEEDAQAWIDAMRDAVYE